MDAISTFVMDSLRADTICKKGNWGIRMLKNGQLVKEEYYKGHSECYAEDAAENYVFGIKKIGVQ